MTTALKDTVQRRFTVEEYYHMAESGVLSPDERVELIEGIIYRMSPEEKRHAVAIELARKLFATRLAGRAGMRAQHPLTLSGDTEPEPDFAVVEEEDPRAYLGSHPKTALLVIEVAYSSLDKDRTSKADLYAKAGIPEYWLENLVDDTLEVFRDPARGKYRDHRTLHRGESIAPVAFPDIELAVGDLLP